MRHGQWAPICSRLPNLSPDLPFRCWTMGGSWSARCCSPEQALEAKTKSQVLCRRLHVRLRRRYTFSLEIAMILMNLNDQELKPWTTLQDALVMIGACRRLSQSRQLLRSGAVRRNFQTLGINHAETPLKYFAGSEIRAGKHLFEVPPLSVLAEDTKP